MNIHSSGRALLSLCVSRVVLSVSLVVGKTRRPQAREVRKTLQQQRAPSRSDQHQQRCT